MQEGLLEVVRNYLHITWIDENTDKNLTDAINSSMARLREIAGVSTVDFTVEGLARDLLKDRCRYINSQALEMFEKNFASELMSLHIKSQVDAESDVVDI
ncbi:hypothetical protein [Clostridium tagluense]|uniref:Uncharacterized protein n=1 Tax=Clostridium tagluense TaxID=360422 RepID=A0A401UUH5_9CLOT|nr:hypothetical protein [Clostridium tagluense]GCD13191.1 hypothetical protein Ctaglu_48140 [Clostridium tagluense]